MGSDRKRPEDILFEEGKITAEDRDWMRRHDLPSGTPEELWRLMNNDVSRADVYRAAAESLGLEYVDLDSIELDPEVYRIIPPSHCLKRNVLPLRMADKSKLAVAMSKLDAVVLDDLRLVAGAEIVPVLAQERQLADKLSSLIEVRWR